MLTSFIVHFLPLLAHLGERILTRGNLRSTWSHGGFSGSLVGGILNGNTVRIPMNMGWLVHIYIYMGWLVYYNPYTNPCFEWVGFHLRKKKKTTQKTDVSPKKRWWLSNCHVNSLDERPLNGNSSDSIPFPCYEKIVGTSRFLKWWVLPTSSWNNT